MGNLVTLPVVPCDRTSEGFTPAEPWPLATRYCEARARSTFDIALVNVPYGTSGQSMRPLGLTSLGAYLEKNGFRARGFDFSDCKETPEDLVRTYRLSEFPAVGLSFYNINAVGAYKMAAAIKRDNPHCILIAGGPHVSALGANVFTTHPEIDIIVRNEGEEPLVDLLRSLHAKKAIDKLPGLVSKFNGCVAVGPERSRIDDLDSLPPPIFEFESPYPPKPLFFYDRELGRLKSAVAIVTSRSCPFRCSFCAIILIGRKWRKSSPEKVVSDLEALERHNGTQYEHLYFLDANFFVDARRTIEVAQALHRYRPQLTFSFSTRVNQLARGEALVPQLRDLGLRAVELGIESGSESALKRFTKDTTPEQNQLAIEVLMKNRLELFLDFIMFDAEATVDDLRANLKFLEQNGLDSYVPWDHIVSHMTPYLGTAIRDHYESLLGKKFSHDELPKPEDLIVNDKVRSIFLEISKMQEEFPRLAISVDRLEGNRIGEWSVENARLTLNSVTIRRLPFMVLRSLVAQAEAGLPISYRNAIPTLQDDAGVEISLDQFLNYAVQ